MQKLMPGVLVIDHRQEAEWQAGADVSDVERRGEKVPILRRIHVMNERYCYESAKCQGRISVEPTG